MYGEKEWSRALVWGEKSTIVSITVCDTHLQTLQLWMNWARKHRLNKLEDLSEENSQCFIEWRVKFLQFFMEYERKYTNLIQTAT